MDFNRSNNSNGSAPQHTNSDSLSTSVKSSTNLCENSEQGSDIETVIKTNSDMHNRNGKVVSVSDLRLPQSKGSGATTTAVVNSYATTNGVKTVSSCDGSDLNARPECNSNGYISTSNEDDQKEYAAPSSCANKLLGDSSQSNKSNRNKYNDYINQTYSDTSRRQSVEHDDTESHPEEVRLLIDTVPTVKIVTTDENASSPFLPFVAKAKEKLPRSIVKSPSSNSFKKNFKSKADRNRLSLQCSTENGASVQDGGPDEYERPVLHVQFMPNHIDAPPSASSLSDRRSDCKSPIGPFGSFTPSTSSPCSSSSSSSSSDDGSSIGQYAEARAPDGGWGWVVVFASFMVNLIADGITFSFGVIFVEFLNYFGEGKAKTAWIGSLFMAIPLLSGPIASFLTDRYGCRKVTIAGSILACIGFVLSSFTTSMEMLFFTFGILAGFGLSLCYVAAVVIVAYYFEKKRSFATGLSVCGSGIGTFIFAPLTQMLLEEYGWRGTTLILAGIFLNMTVCGMLMKDLEWTTHRAKKRAKERKKNKLAVSSDSFSATNSINTGGTSTNLNQPNGDGNDITEINGFKVEDFDDPRLFSSLVTLPTFVRNGEKVPLEVMELFATHRNVHNLLMQNYPGLLHSRSFSEPYSSHPGMSQEAVISPSNPENLKSTSIKKKIRANTEEYHNQQAMLNWLKRMKERDSRTPPSAAYLKDLRMHRHSLTYRGAMLNINRYRLRASSCPDIYRNSMTTIAKEESQWSQGIEDFRNLFLDILDFSYFTDIRFLLFALSNFLLYTWYDVPYVYLTDNAIEMGISEADASLLIGIIGIVNMLGEIALGWIGDVKGVSASVVYAVCMAFCGAITALVPVSSSYTWLCCISGLFGLFIAANYSLTSIILVELITIERFTNAYGLLLLVQGIANLVGPPLAGWIYDVTGTYDLSFYIAGFFIALSGLMLVILPAHGKYRKYRGLKRRTPSELSETPQLPPGQQTTNNKCNGTITTQLTDCFNKELLKETVKANHV